MRFLIDADSPYSLLQVFKNHEYDAVHVRDILKFSTDDKIFEYANKNQFIVVTRDLGFAELFIEYKGVGLILIRLPYYFKSDRVIKAFDEFLSKVDTKKLLNSITVLELGRYRIKKL